MFVNAEYGGNSIDARRNVATNLCPLTTIALLKTFYLSTLALDLPCFQ